MKLDGFYTSGEFAKMAQVSVRTIRFYDKQNILKPSFVNASGARFYTDGDLARLQQILLLKYLGFSLDDIRLLTIDDGDSHMLLSSLKLQLKLVQDRIEQMQMVEKAILDTTATIEQAQSVDWSQMLDLIHLTNMEKSLKSQYQNSTNISARIQLHALYSVNRQGWFPWVFQQCDVKDGMRVLEIGCGDGSLWKENVSVLPEEVSVVLSDISEGMLRDARRAVGVEDGRFAFSAFDCHRIPYPDESFDVVIANHVLFYCEDLQKVCGEIRRVLKPEGKFVCSTYGAHHMQEVGQLVTEFDGRITLSAEKLFEKFGLENGADILSDFFSSAVVRRYEDQLLVDAPEPLIEYILSCHGNQNQFILERYKEFRNFVGKKIGKCFSITKEAGVFICEK